jgi:acetyl-CoA carboxylase biotin carboxyl carrier protein
MGTLPFELEIEDIAALADIMNEKELGEIRLEDEDIGAKLIIKKSRPVPPPPPPMPQCPPPPPPMQAPAGGGFAGFDEKPAQKQEQPAPEGETVKAPVVGTYYSSPAPDKPPFVQVGQKIKRGDIIMIIESMKIMNEIPSPVDGVVKKLLVKNGEAVEFDQPIMIIG